MSGISVVLIMISTSLLTRIHPQPLLADPSLTVHNPTTNVQFPSGPGNFLFLGAHGVNPQHAPSGCNLVFNFLFVDAWLFNQLQLT